ncbi:hydroxymethylbilane synthase [Halorhabdus sp. CUG00001]|uniref:hydroxymethylbilane synthase n=1 Tax=Halorhabdus sp. CUG00001 TaxID=2600297 RepID=UPI00131AE901|nr:hydroxymethylbilane synthase [Halorhabdus sp. CUG00001]
MSDRSTTLQVATRGSDLATRQASSVREALASRRQDVELLEVETAGDRIRDELIHRLGKTGAFVHSLDERVLDGEADLAVHSLKDVPTEDRSDLVVAAVPERAPANDVLVSPDGTALEDLDSGATVGTSSLRRKAQLLATRPDLDVQPLRGNVDTRVEKLLAPSLQAEHADRLAAEEETAESADGDATTDDDGSDDPDDSSAEAWFNGLAEIERQALERDIETTYDAIVLAEAGLDRLGLTHHLQFQRLPPREFVPAPGQGALAVVATDEDVTEEVRSSIDHPPSRVEVTVERTILETLGGGCVAPIGVYAVLQGRVVSTTVRVLSGDGTEEVSDRRELPARRHAEAAREMALDLADRGAEELIDRAREATQEQT